MSNFRISLSPHEKGGYTTPKIMRLVCIALIPAFIASVVNFGVDAVIVTAASVFFCVGIEYLIQKFLLKCEVTISDGSAAVTGLLLAFNMPSGIPLWQLFIGAVVAIGVAKMAFGGLGKNPFNPALAGRAFMLMSFPVSMTTWRVSNMSALAADAVSKATAHAADAVTGATPLGIIKEGLKSGSIQDVVSKLPSYWDLFIGNIGGSLGETSALAIILGGIFLMYKKVISWHIPFFFIATIFAFTGTAWLIDPASFVNPLYHILSGGVMLGAFFMLTDMVTSPMCRSGQIVFAVGAGIICSCIRIWGAYPEGCMFSILIMNALVPLIDKYFRPKRFGKEVNYVG